jgi:hypothetical protein
MAEWMILATNTNKMSSQHKLARNTTLNMFILRAWEVAARKNRIKLVIESRMVRPPLFPGPGD